MNDPKVSIIIPVWNTPIDLFKQCLEHIEHQTFNDFECLLCDDKSTDKETVKLAKDYVKKDSRFKYHLCSQHYGGAYGPRNEGLDIAKGEWIVFCDCDDYYEYDGIEALYNTAIENNQKYVTSFTSRDDNRTINITKGEYNINELSDDILEIFSPRIFACWGAIFKRSICTKFNDFIYGEDAIFGGDVLYNNLGNFFVLPVITYTWVKNEDSITQNIQKNKGTLYEKYYTVSMKYINKIDNSEIDINKYKINRVVYHELCKNVPGLPVYSLDTTLTSEERSKLNKFLDQSTHPDMNKIKEISDEAEKNNKIPKIIHFCYLNWKEMDDISAYYVYHWLDKLEGYEFINWTPEILENNKFMSNCLRDKKWAYWADYARVYAVYNYGGFYMDCDVMVYRSFDNLLKYPYIFDNEFPRLYCGNQVPGIDCGSFGAKKGNNLLGTMLNFYNGIKDDKINYSGNIDSFCAPSLWHYIGKLFGYNIKYNAGNLAVFDAFLMMEHSDYDIFVLDSTYMSRTNTAYPHRCLQEHANRFIWDPAPHQYTSHQFFSKWNPKAVPVK